MKCFYTLFFLLLVVACNSPRKQYDIELVFQDEDLQTQGYNASVIEKRLLYQGAVVDSATRINDSTIYVTITTSMDSVLLQMLTQNIGNVVMTTSINYKELEPYMERVYSQAVLLGLIPKVSDEFIEGESTDFSNFLERPSNAELPVLGEVKPRDISFVEAVLQNEKIKPIFPSNLDLKWTGYKSSNQKLQLFAFNKCGERTCLTNEWIDKASLVKEEDRNLYTINISLKDKYIRHFARMTKLNFNKSMPIVVDNKVVLYPVINSVIENGELSISGLNHLEAQIMLTYINVGALKSSVKMRYRNEVQGIEL